MKIAVVEDEAKLAASLKEGLEREGYSVEVLSDGKRALDELIEHGAAYSLVLLDLHLPKMNGFEVCKALRAKEVNLPILVLTARDSIADKVQALDSGADDFLTKPFIFDELLARIRALMRRSQVSSAVRANVGSLKVDLDGRQVWRDGTILSLTPTEFDLLAFMLSQEGKAVTREAISTHLWGLKNLEFSNVVDVHISNLRRKIDDGHDQKLVRTVRRIGYSLHA